MTTAVRIDALQYSNWSRSIFEEMRAGGLNAVHVTVAYHENFRETVDELVAWNWRFRKYEDLIISGRHAHDIDRAVTMGRTAIFFGLQNPSPIESDIGLLQILYDLGIRFMQLSYNNQSLLCSGWTEKEDTGLSNMGREVIAEMNRLGMLIDMSHSAERSTLEAIDASSRPITITHANPASWRATARNKSAAVLKRLADRDGMIGLSLYPIHLQAGSDTTCEAFATMTARLAEQIGAEHVGIGSDLCRGQPGSVLAWMREGRWRVPVAPTDQTPVSFPAQPEFFESSADFPKLAEGLLRIGFVQSEINGILGENWARFFRQGFVPLAL